MKKYIKVFLFSFILFCSIFFVNNCNADSFEMQYFTNYNDLKDYFFSNGFDSDLMFDSTNYTSNFNLEYDLDSTWWNRAFSLLSTNQISSLNGGQGLACNNIVISRYRRINANNSNILDYYHLSFISELNNDINLLKLPTGQRNTYDVVGVSSPNYYLFSFYYNYSTDTFTLQTSLGSGKYGIAYRDYSSSSSIVGYTFSTISIQSSGGNLLYTGAVYPFYSPSLTVIDNPNSDVVITYEYNEDFSSCHVDATIRNGAFSDKLYYSYQMPSIAGQGLTLGKTAFPSRWS